MHITKQGLTALATGLTIMAMAQTAAAQSAAGAEEYTRACASCHGLTGRGDGPLAEYMSIPVPDVTQIRTRNNGVFPMLEVIHPMPIWDDRFEAAVASELGDVGTEIAVRGRVLALATYLEAIQQ
jgi:mono/diheme cytochrome c family protein